MKGTIIYRAISLTDLEKAGYRFSIEDNPVSLKIYKVKKDGKPMAIDEFYEGLFILGIQLNKHISLQDRCQHLRLDGTRTNNYRIGGQERNDKDWLNSGYASEEAILSTSRMSDMTDRGITRNTRK